MLQSETDQVVNAAADSLSRWVVFESYGRLEVSIVMVWLTSAITLALAA